MTDLREDLTLALRRRAERVTVENDLDAILEDHHIVRFSTDNAVDSRRNRILLVAASVALLIGAGGLIWATNARTRPPAASSETPMPVDTSPGEVTTESTPSGAPVTIAAEFPDLVPVPDTFDLMTHITSDNEPVGWEFYDQGEPTDSVERCTRYASTFDASWTSSPKTDEHESVIYARIFDNGQWQVGIYCINDGGYLVQVMPTGAILPPAADTVTPRDGRPTLPLASNGN